MKTTLTEQLCNYDYWKRYWGYLLTLFVKRSAIFLLVFLFIQTQSSAQIKSKGNNGSNYHQSSSVSNNSSLRLLGKKYDQIDDVIYVQEEVLVRPSLFGSSAAGTPCNAHRWIAGDGWRQNTSDNTLVNKWQAITLSSPNLQPKGIVRCASSAETESGLQAFKAPYDISSNPISAILPQTDCYNMNNESFGNPLSAPTQGEDIVWLNFDIRPFAGTYQFQIVSNENVGFVLFNVDPTDAKPINGITSGTKYPVPDNGLSGNCSNLDFANIVQSGIIHPACGLSGNGWTTITVPSFQKPTNYYLAMWMADPNKTTFPGSMNLIYKSRYGCGGATCTLEYDKTSVICNNNGTYSVCLNYGGSEGRWQIKDNSGLASSVSYTTYKQDGTTIVSSGSTPTNPLLMTLGTIPDGAVFAKVCATYPIGTPYDISLLPDPTFKPNNDYVQCSDGDRQTGLSPVNPTLVADATPHCSSPTVGISCIDLTSAAHNAQLFISSISPGGIGDYNYLWNMPPNANGTLTGANTANAIYTAAVTDASQSLEFIVTATPKDSSRCATTSLVTVFVGSRGSCNVSGPDSICGNTTNTYTGSPNPVPANAAYDWVLSGYGGIGSTNATLSSSNGLATIDVLSSNQSYRLTLNQTFDNPDLNSSCFIDVYVKPNSSSSTDVSVCSNTPTYLWNGIVRSAPGTYTYTTTNAVGCDSVATLILTVRQTSTSTTSVSVCSNTPTYLWNGIVRSAPGTYTFTTTNAVGCDSVATLILTVSETSTSTTSVSVCSNTPTYLWNGIVRSAPGTYTYTTTNAVGCDSVATLILTLRQTSTSTTNISVCSNTPTYLWNGIVRSAPGTYTFTTTNAVGCDSVATLILTLRQTSTSTTSVSVCSNTPTYLWNGIVRSAPGTYTYTTTNAVGCDSVATLILTVRQTSTSTTSVSVCSNTPTYLWNGIVRSAPGTYTFTTTNAVGCDSVATLILTVRQTSTSTTSVSVCSNTPTYLWNGIVRSAPGTYTFTTTNAVGCDSVATLILTVSETSTSTTSVSVCSNTPTYLWNGIVRSAPGTYTFTSTNAVGCDSVATLILTLRQTSTSTTNISVCSNTPTYLWNGIVRSAPGTYTYTTTNAVGCDSVATLILTLRQTSTSTTNISVCSNTPTYLWNGIVRSAPGTYTFTSTNAVGCDSVATLILTLRQTSTSTTNISVCSNTPTYLWNGIVRSAPGTYTYTTTNAVGCDSVATLILTLRQTSTSTTSVSVCSNTPTYLWNGIVRSAPGTYTFTSTNAVGCDSVATLILTLRQTSTSTTNISVCSNTPTYLWNGIVRSAPGTYTFTTTNAVGCDSVATLILTLRQTSTSTTSVSVCSNTPTYLWNGIVRSAPGTYTYTTTNAVGCDSVATLILTVRQTSTSTTSVSVCSNTPTYLWNGIVRSAPGTYTFTTTNAVGCDSVATLILTLRQTSTSTTNISVCSNTPTYLWNGIVRSAPGTYTFTTTNAVGCDSVATLILTLRQTSTSTTNISVCSNTPTYLWNGIVRSAPGTYTFTSTNAVGCDSVATLILTLRQTSTSTTNISVCSNTPTYLWNGIVRSAPGTYTYTTTNAVGCDSVATLILTLRQTSTSTTNISVCSNTPTYLWNGIVRSAPGTYTFTSTNAVGCDSVATLILTLRQTSTSTTNISVCSNTPTYLWNGIVRSAPGTYTYTTTNAVGCDSVATLILTLRQTSTSTTSVSVCSNTPTYLWNGIVRSAPGTYTFTSTNAVGCDSVATLILTVRQTSTSTTSVSVCSNTPTYLWNGIVRSAPGTYTYTTTNAVGCDSVATLILTLRQTSTSTTNISVCSNTPTYLWNGIVRSAPGTYTYTTTNAVGCDSVATLILTLRQTSTSTTSVSVCSNTPTYLWNGIIRSAPGTYSYTTTNAVGCDSVATLILTLRQTSTSTTQISVCSNTPTYLWNGIVRSAPGTYTYTTTNAVGCDSVATLILTLRQTSTSTTSVSVCSNTPTYLWNGIVRSAPGTYTFTTTNAVGCDSVATLILTLRQTSTSTTNISVCSNTPTYLWNGIVRSAPGTYTFTTTNAVGCDSVATLILTLRQTSTSTTNISVCSNTPTYLWNGIVRSAPGTYTYTTTNAVGCDSVATLILTVRQTSTSTTSVSVCSNTPTYLWNGIVRSAPGTYTFTTTNAVGCDSVATLILTVRQTSTSTTQISVCSNTPTYLWNGIVRSAPGTYTFTTTNAVGCDSVATLILTVRQTSTSTTQISVCSNTPTYLWNDIVRSAPGTYTYTTTNAVGCDSVATLILTVRQTSTSTTSVSVCSNTPTYLWNDIVRSAPGTYTYTTTNAVGCDSVATLILTVRQTSTSTTQISVCSNTPTYLWNDIVRSAPGTYTYTTTNAVGCDSVATLILTVRQTSTSTTSVSVCSNTPTYLWNDIVRSAPGTYTYTTTNAVGCDSVATLILTVKQTSSSTTEVAVCANNGQHCTTPPTYLWNGIVRTAPGTYTYITTNAVGCDSIATLILTIKLPSTSITEVAVCANNGQQCTTPPTYLWNGIVRTAPGTYTYITTNAVGCDSIATLILTIKLPTKSTTSVALCANSGEHCNIPPTYLWNGIVRTAPGIYTYVTTNAAGCDSIAKLILTVLPLPRVKVNSPHDCIQAVICATPLTGPSCDYNYNWTVPAGFTNPGNVQCFTTTVEGTYSVVITNKITFCSSVSSSGVYDKHCPCDNLLTYTQGGWGSVSCGNNPGSYLNYPGRFSSVFSCGLMIGCMEGNTLKLTSAQAVTNFLPSGSTPRALPNGMLINPTRSSYANVFAGQLVALTLNVKLDSAIYDFAPSVYNLKDMYITSGLFTGWTVSKFLEEANKKIGGCCTSPYSYAQYCEAADKINNSFEGGYKRNDYLSCRKPRNYSSCDSKLIKDLVSSSNQFEIGINPNPAKTQTVLSFLGTSGEVAIISVYDLNGKLLNLEKKSLMSNGINYHRLDLNNFSDQIIIIKVQCGNRISTSRLMVHH